MNAVLDVLKLRRVKLDYVSPAVCPGLAVTSSSGSGISVEANEGAEAPLIRFGGQCDAFLLWNDILDLVCMSVFQSQDPLNPDSPYVLLAECVPLNNARVCSPGWWVTTTIDRNGVEGPQSSPALSDGSTPLLIPISKNPGDKAFRLYKNPDPLNIAGTYSLVLESTTFGTVELCQETGCYRAQAITDDGASDLSAALCRNEMTGCCPPQPCSATESWDPQLCSCVPCPLSDITSILPPVCVGSSFHGTFEALNGIGPVLWEHVGGVLPPGLIFGSGLIPGIFTELTGTPTEIGPFVFTIRATDATGCSKEKDFTVSTMQVAPLPDAHTDTSYSQQVEVSGGTPPLSFSVVSGQMPVGLSVSPTGLVSGTAKFTGFAEIGVEDNQGLICRTSLNVLGCPVAPLSLTIPSWDTDPFYRQGVFDRDNRVWWLTGQNSPLFNSPRRIALIDTFANAFSGYATDPLGLLNTNPKNSTNGSIVLDTKYNQVVFLNNQNWASFYDRSSAELLSVNSYGVACYSFGNESTSYDASRGLIYYCCPNVGNFLITSVDCNPGNRGDSNLYTSGGFDGGALTYCPDNDTVYVANSGGSGGFFHLWNPTTHAFTFDQGGAGGSVVNIYYIRVLKLIAAYVPGSGVTFFDPLNGNAVVGFGAYAGTSAPRGDMEYGICGNRVAICSGGQPNGVIVFDPSSGFSASTVPWTAGRVYYSLTYDDDGNRLWVYDWNNSDVVSAIE